MKLVIDVETNGFLVGVRIERRQPKKTLLTTAALLRLECQDNERLIKLLGCMKTNAHAEIKWF